MDNKTFRNSGNYLSISAPEKSKLSLYLDVEGGGGPSAQTLGHLRVTILY